MITIDDINLPVIASTICKNASTLCMQKLINSLAKEPRNTQCANKREIWMLDTKDKKTDLQSIVKDKCKNLSADPCQRSYCSFSLMSRFLMAPSVTGKTKPVSFQQRKRIPHHSQAFPVPSAKKTQDTLIKLRGCVNWGY
jgi:hypothetical protein